MLAMGAWSPGLSVLSEMHALLETCRRASARLVMHLSRNMCLRRLQCYCQVHKKLNVGNGDTMHDTYKEWTGRVSV